MSNFFRPLLGAAVVAISMVLAAPTLAQNFRLAHHHPVNGQIDVAAKKFAELVSEKSGGAITIQIFPGAQLGQELEAFDLLNQGGIDITLTSTPLLDRVYPPMAMTVLPFVFRDWDHVQAAFQGEFGEALADGVRQNSETEILAWLGLGFKDMMFRGDALTSLDSLAGVRIRSPEQFVYIRMFELLGASPTPVTWGEVYTAMQTGVATGLETPPALVVDMRFYEVVDSLVRSHHMFSAMVIAMNKNRFASLDEESQEIIRAAAVEAALWTEENVIIPDEQQAYAELEQLGMSIHEVEDIEDWRDAVSPLWTEIEEVAPGSAHYVELLNSIE